jgi:hypothetical protein
MWEWPDFSSKSAYEVNRRIYGAEVGEHVFPDLALALFALNVPFPQANFRSIGTQVQNSDLTVTGYPFDSGKSNP